MIVRKKVDVNREPTQEQIDMLMEASKYPIEFDEDNPELTDEDLAQFYRVSDKKQEESQKQTVSGPASHRQSL